MELKMVDITVGADLRVCPHMVMQDNTSGQPQGVAPTTDISGKPYA